jgi:tripartite-type tricarboxylate transporter receptor subunit TctC
MQRALLALSLALSSLMLTAGSAAAQYPSKPIRLIVPFPAGGPSDAAARVLAQALATSFAQPVVVDNMPGASGAIAARAVRLAPTDGYTLLWGVSSMVALPLVQKSAALEVLADFEPISMVCQFPFGMAVNPAVPAGSIDAFVRYARVNPGKISFASATLSEFMAATQFMKASGITMTRVPYKGGAQAIPDLVAGRVQIYFTPISLLLPHMKAGQLRVLGTLLPQRTRAMPDVPTMTEAGMPGVSVPSWQAVFAPPKTPRNVVDTLSRQVALVLRDANVAKQFDALTLKLEPSTPEMLRAAITEDLEKWRVFIRENGISQE